MDAPPSLAARLIALVVSTALSLGLAEAVVRQVDDGALPTLGLYEATSTPPGLALRAEAEARSQGAGRTFTVRTGAHGLRHPVPARVDWLVVGDSQVLGLGVEDGETFAAALTEAGLGAANAGVVGYGVEDAIARASVLLPVTGARGVVIAVNRVNDPEEVGRAAASRLQVAGGWLLPREASPGLVAFYGSPLARLHLLHQAAHLVLAGASPVATPPAWVLDPGEDARVSRRLTELLDAFVAEVAPAPVVVVELPLDVLVAEGRRATSSLAALVPESAAQAWRARHQASPLDAAGVGYHFVDVSPALRERPEAFLDGDYHLSPTGHASVAGILVPELRRIGLPGGRLRRRGHHEIVEQRDAHR